LLSQQPYTETELIAALQAQDEQALSYLYDHYGKALFGVIYQIIPQQNVAEDILQEVFLKIWQNIATYHADKGRLYTWMLQIARHTAIDKTRSKDFNKQSKTITINDNVYTQKAAGTNNMEDIGLRKTINTLPEDSRKLLELSYFQGYTQEEIANILQIPLGTVKTRIRSTLLQLRKLLGGSK
jgi:RNA polymerase sigma-70 factor (ECF subfamily)